MANRVVVLETDKHPLVLRDGPALRAVREFVQAQHARAVQGVPAGPSGEPAYRIYSARAYDSEEAWLAGDPGKKLDISAALEAASNK